MYIISFQVKLGLQVGNAGGELVGLEINLVFDEVGDTHDNAGMQGELGLHLGHSLIKLGGLEKNVGLHITNTGGKGIRQGLQPQRIGLHLL